MVRVLASGMCDKSKENCISLTVQLFQRVPRVQLKNSIFGVRIRGFLTVMNENELFERVIIIFMIVVGIIAGVLYITKLMVDYYWMGEDVRITLFHIKKTLPNVPSVRKSLQKNTVCRIRFKKCLFGRRCHSLNLNLGLKLIKEKKYTEESFGITNKKEYAQ